MGATFSKALPIRVWLNGQETFNEAVVSGMEPVKWLYKAKLSDVIRYQIIDTENKPYRVIAVAYDEDVTAFPAITEIGTKNFETLIIGSSYVYNITFTLTELGVTDKSVVRLIFVSGDAIIPVTTEISGDLAVSGIVGEFAGTATVSPSNVDLTFDEYIGGEFQFTLSGPLPSAINISAANVQGSIIPGCATSDETDSLSELITIASGSVVGVGSGSTPFVSSTTYAKVDAITVNGNTYNDGDTFSVGLITVTIIIGPCVTYIP